jgi:alpha-glucoside transport system permease protein
MEAATATAPVVVPKPGESTAAKIGRLAAKLPFQILMILVAAMWIVPTFGLLLISLTPSDVIDKQGWWKLVSHPSQITFDNYNALFDNKDLMSALWTTAQIAVANTVILIFVAALAGYAFCSCWSSPCLSCRSRWR